MTRPTGLVLGLLLWASSVSSALAGKPAAGAFVPDASVAGAPPLDGQVWKVEAEGFTARLAMLDDASRQRYLRERAGSSIDPFAAAAREGPPAFLTFLLDLENRGGGNLYFQPLMCPIMTPKGDIRNPLDLPSIQTVYEMLDQKMPPAYAAVGKALFADQVVLPPGGSASGLLVYRTADLKTRTLRLEVRATTSSGETLQFQVPYRFAKAKEERKGS